MQLTESLQGELRRNEPLAPYTSWRVGGSAETLYLPKNLADLSHFLKQLPADVPLTWLGLGSNTLVRDTGVKGVVIVTQGALNGLAKTDTHTIRAEAGVSAAQLARFCARQSGEGLEFMAGIPGTVGGALAMNAGCFNGETWGHVSAVETINRFGEIKHRTPQDFSIAYREVIRPKEEWFVSGFFKFSAGDKAKSLEIIRALLERRSNTQPTGTANCGSVFRNPPGNHAAKLIEAAGLKGTRIGGAVVSTKHANFIINEHGATAKDIEALTTLIMQRVEESSHIRLIPEYCVVG